MEKVGKNQNFGKIEKFEKFTQIHISRRDINVFMFRGCWHMLISQKTRSRKNLMFFMCWSISERWGHLFLIVLEVPRLRNKNARSHTWNYFRVLIQIEKIMSNFGETSKQFLFSVNFGIELETGGELST